MKLQSAVQPRRSHVPQLRSKRARSNSLPWRVNATLYSDLDARGMRVDIASAELVICPEIYVAAKQYLFAGGDGFDFEVLNISYQNLHKVARRYSDVREEPNLRLSPLYD